MQIVASSRYMLIGLLARHVLFFSFFRPLFCFLLYAFCKNDKSESQMFCIFDRYIFASPEQLKALAQVLETRDRRDVMKRLQISVVYDAEVTWWAKHERMHPHAYIIHISYHHPYSKGLFQMMPAPSNGQKPISSTCPSSDTFR